MGVSRTALTTGYLADKTLDQQDGKSDFSIAIPMLYTIKAPKKQDLQSTKGKGIKNQNPLT